MIEHRLVVFGGGGVGKSSLTIQFVQNCFVKEYDPTIEDSYRKQVTIDDEICNLDILDTAEREECGGLRELNMRTYQGFLLVYSITSRSSFDEISSFRDYVFRLKDRDQLPFFLVGNKCDLDNDKQVTTEEGQEMAKSFGCPFVETSAKTRINVESAFFDLVREIRKDDQKNSGFPGKPKNKKNVCLIQ